MLISAVGPLYDFLLVFNSNIYADWTLVLDAGATIGLPMYDF